MGSNKAEVDFVIPFSNSSKEYPIANLVATFAIGYPVAFDAHADERETLGLISMAIMSSFSSGETANCTLHPPSKSPIERII